jgi:hypothetical protein
LPGPLEGRAELVRTLSPGQLEGRAELVRTLSPEQVEGRPWAEDTWQPAGTESAQERSFAAEDTASVQVGRRDIWSEADRPSVWSAEAAAGEAW